MNKIQKIDIRWAVKARFPRVSDLPPGVITQGHMGNLHFDDVIKGRRVRVWVSRMTKEDGMPYDNAIEVETYDTGKDRWVDCGHYKPLKEYKGVTNG